MSLREKGGALSLIQSLFLFPLLFNFCLGTTAVRVSEQTIPVTVNGQTRSVVVPFWVLPSGVTAPPPASSLAPVVVSILSEALLTFPSAASTTSAFIPPVPVAGSTYNAAKTTSAVTGGFSMPTGNAISVLESALSTFMVPGATAITVVLPVPVTDASATARTTEVIQLPPTSQTSEPTQRASSSTVSAHSEVSTSSSEPSVHETTTSSTSSRKSLPSSSSHRSTIPTTTTSKTTTKPTSSRPNTSSKSLSSKPQTSVTHRTSSGASSENASSTAATITTTTRAREQTSVPPAPNAKGGAASGTICPVFLAVIAAVIGALLVQRVSV